MHSTRKRKVPAAPEVPMTTAAMEEDEGAEAESGSSGLLWEDDDDDDAAFQGSSSSEEGEEGAAKAGECQTAEGRAIAQQKAVDETAALLGVTPGSSALLLRSFRWNKEDMVSRYMEDPDAVCLAAGVAKPSEPARAATSVAAPPGVVCAICREEGGPSTALQLTALDCGHTYCDGCWSTYVALKVTDGETSIRCPAEKCPLRVPEELVRRLCSAEVAARFVHFMRLSYVDERRGAAWCPTAGCSLAVDTSAGGLFFSCAAGHSFCAGCKHAEAHAPAPCDIVRTWQKKAADESETFNWLSINTQDCPSCKSTIEKNGGCNHMTCKSCKAEFCWVCLGKWASHESFYQCNVFKGEDAAAKEKEKESTRAALDRYLFHFRRWANHEASRKLEGVTRAAVEAKMRALQEASPGSAGWGDIAFVQNANEEVMASRQVLKWTYVLAYNLAEGAPEKELFCYLQQDLETRTERLSGLLEKEPEVLLQPEVRAEVLALTGVAAGARKKLLKGAPTTGIVSAAVAAGAAGPS